MKSMQKNEAGFTLIELVVVIVILGILAATALPKFIDLSSDAKVAALQGLKGSMAGANTMVYAKSAAAGQSATLSTATPAPTVVGVATNLGFAKDAASLIPALTLTSDFAVSGTTAIAYTKAKDFATAPLTCAVVYTPASSTTDPGYAVVSTGC